MYLEVSLVCTVQRTPFLTVIFKRGPLQCGKGDEEEEGTPVTQLSNRPVQLEEVHELFNFWQAHPELTEITAIEVSMPEAFCSVSDGGPHEFIKWF